MQTAEARRETNRRYYERTKAEQLEKRKAWKREFFAWYTGLKAKPCEDCGFEFHHAVMQYDHIGTDKTANVSALVKLGNRQKVLDEISKCELVCANCHAMRTWGRQNKHP